jgi:bacterioferritin
MASNELKEKLNDAIAREIQVSIQYMWQHVTVPGLHAQSVGGVFKKFAITEMKHAEEIAERLNNLGGTPTTKPTPITVGKTMKEMLEVNAKAEKEAIALYREIIKMAEKEEDIVTRKLFESILVDEEEHYYVFMGLLGE